MVLELLEIAGRAVYRRPKTPKPIYEALVGWLRKVRKSGGWQKNVVD